MFYDLYPFMTYLLTLPHSMLLLASRTLMYLKPALHVYTRQKPLDIHIELKAVGVAVYMKRIFWVVAPCSSERAKRFRGKCRLHI
jgi:hypothetical protein